MSQLVNTAAWEPRVQRIINQRSLIRTVGRVIREPKQVFKRENGAEVTVPLCEWPNEGKLRQPVDMLSVEGALYSQADFAATKENELFFRLLTFVCAAQPTRVLDRTISIRDQILEQRASPHPLRYVIMNYHDFMKRFLANYSAEEIDHSTHERDLEKGVRARFEDDVKIVISLQCPEGQVFAVAGQDRETFDPDLLDVVLVEPAPAVLAVEERDGACKFTFTQNTGMCIPPSFVDGFRF